MTQSVRAQKRQTQRQTIRRELDKMCAETPKPHEAAMYAEIKALPQVPVISVSVPYMKPHDCHTNCAYFCHANTTYAMVHGWVIDGLGRAIVHTVVKSRQGFHMCITPNPLRPDLCGFMFTPDPNLEVPFFHERPVEPRPINRNGIPVGVSVREDPEACLALYREARKRLR